MKVADTLSTSAQELHRLAKFGANLADAYSCFIFLPERITRMIGRGGSATGDALHLVAYHSLSQEVIPEATLPVAGGLIGWVSTHRRSIHVSPFEHDSRTLGVYSNDQQLKSFIGIPISFSAFNGQSASGVGMATGVVGCDSKKAFAFSKLQGKLLEDLSEQIGSTVSMLIRSQSGGAGSSDGWQRFSQRADDLVATLGLRSVEAIRVRLTNFSEFEGRIGSQRACEFSEQLVRLIAQALPPRSPLVQLANGDLVMMVDNMMTSFYESKITALARHLCPPHFEPQLQFFRGTTRRRAVETAHDLIAATIPDHIVLDGGLRAVHER